MSYICAKKLNLSGKVYRPGEPIPDEAFLDGRAAKLQKFGYVVEAGGEAPAPAPAPVLLEQEPEEPVLSVVFQNGEEFDAYPVNTEQLQTIADTMQKTAAEIVEGIEQVTDETVLIFLLKLDSRKTVRDAVQKRIDALTTLPTQPGSSDSANAQAVSGGDTENSNTPEQ